MIFRLSGRLNYEHAALAVVFRNKLNTFLFFSLAPAVSLLYMFLLPSLPAGGLVPDAIRFITPVQIIFSVTFGVLLSLVVVLNIQAFRMNVPSARGSAIGSVLASLVNGLCCTPLVPLVIALTGASTPVLFQYSPPIQAFFEKYASYFYLMSAILLLFSIHSASKGISCCRRTG